MTPKQFWKKVEVSTPEQCWAWIGYLAKDGYGVCGYNGNVRHAHRVAWFLTFGEVSDPKIMVCHTCDNRRCCNPSHLFLGSAKDNIQDAKKKGRLSHPSGEWANNAKLSDSDVVELRKLFSNGHSRKNIARKFNVAIAHVSRLLHGGTGHTKEGALPPTNLPALRALLLRDRPLIIRRIWRGEGLRAVAKTYGVNRATISKIWTKHRHSNR